ncbi:hypothetical protein VTG60DRAFT_2664 [Thermothelomyces hinnuleus]
MLESGTGFGAVPDDEEEIRNDLASGSPVRVRRKDTVTAFDSKGEDPSLPWNNLWRAPSPAVVDDRSIICDTFGPLHPQFPDDAIVEWCDDSKTGATAQVPGSVINAVRSGRSKYNAVRFLAVYYFVNSCQSQGEQMTSANYKTFRGIDKDDATKIPCLEARFAFVRTKGGMKAVLFSVIAGTAVAVDLREATENDGDYITPALFFARHHETLNL